MNTELIIDDLRLNPIPFAQRDAAVQALEAGDITNFFNTVSKEDSLLLLAYNWNHFCQLGFDEPAVLHAFMASHTNYLSDLVPYSEIGKRLREAGQPLPGAGPFTVYRGVAGDGRDRRVRGYWWTSSFESAQQQANQLGADQCLPKPAVYRTTVKEQDVRAYIKDGQQEVFILFPWNIERIQRVCSMDNGNWKFTAGFRCFDVQSNELHSVVGNELNGQVGEEVHDN